MATSSSNRRTPRATLGAIGAGLGVAVAVWLLSLTPWYVRLEGPALDARFRLRPPITRAPNITAIVIDAQALDQQKAWPWPRDRHTRLLGLTTAVGVRAIGFDIFFPEAAPAASITRDDYFARDGQISADDFPDYDSDLAFAIADAGNVYLAQLFSLGGATAVETDPQKLVRLDNQLRTGVRAGRALRVSADVARRFPLAQAPDAIPLTRLGDAAHGVGTVQVQEDADGVVRHWPMLVRYDLEIEEGAGREPCLFPSLPLVMACQALGLNLSELRFDEDGSVVLPGARNGGGDIVIPLDEDGQALVNWAGPWNGTFNQVSYAAFAGIEEGLQWAAAKQALADAGPDVWDQGPRGLVPALSRVTQDNDQLRIYLQVFSGAHTYQALLDDDPATAAADALPRVLGQAVEIPEAYAQQETVFLNVAAHRAAIRGESRPARVSDTQWENAQVVATVLAAAGGVQPEDEPFYFHGAPVYADDRVVFAARESPVLRDAFCFYGLTAAGTHDMKPMPLSSVYPMLGLHPNVFSSIVTDQLLHEMPRKWRLPIFIVAGLLVALYAVDRGPAAVAVATAIVGGAYVVLAYQLFVRAGWVVDVVGPVLAVLGGAAVVAYQGYRREEKQRRFIRGAFEQYMNVNIVEQIASNPDQLKLGGQDLDATAFFSDVAGFTTISESLTSQELVALLNEYLTAMTEIVFQYDGLLDKYEGDAIIAIFGAPVQTDDHATKACHASLDMQRKLTEMRREWKAQGRHELTARIGLNSGNMVVGNMGSTMRFDYTMMGDTVNLASRLEGANKQYSTYLMCSEYTLDRCNGSVQARELDLLRVKGKTEPVRVFEVYGKQGESVDASFAEAVAHYLKGLQLYKEWKFAEAVTEFEQALAIRPEDGPSKTYLERCRICALNPPPADWDGVFTMTTK